MKRMQDTKRVETRIDTSPKIGRRGCPRLRLGIPAQLVTLDGLVRCILVELSRTGARTELKRPLAVGDGAFLQCGNIDRFAIVVRREGQFNGFEFETPLSNEQVLKVRSYSESFAENELREWRKFVREWVTGVKE